MKQLFSLEGKVALVTGGSRGIGMLMRARAAGVRRQGLHQFAQGRLASAIRMRRFMSSDRGLEMRPLTAAARLLAASIGLAGCGGPASPPAPTPLEVSTLTVVAQDVPVNADYVAQTQSSQAVNIQARVSGFLDRRVYTEGSPVKAGEVLFQMDQKPFQVQVDADAAALQRSQAALDVARANLARTEPLVKLTALSQKDLDNATGQFEQAAAEVEQAKAQLESAKLNLSYTTITAPVAGLSSYAEVADGTYLNAINSQLTTVSVMTPMWVNFSIAENRWEIMRKEIAEGHLRLPEKEQMIVEIVRSDGSVFPFTATISFADPSYDTQTGTFLIRATVDNPKGDLRPNQYVRARVIGAVRPKAIMIPQRAVQQGAKGHFVWILNKAGQAEQRPVQVGDWYQDHWFIPQGLVAGDDIIVEGTQRLSQGATVKVVPQAAAAGS